MQKKHIQRKRLQYEEALKVAAKEDVSFFGQCTKFRERSTEPAPIDRAIQFLFLKENVYYSEYKNVDRKIALQFGSRRLCKIDSTRQYDGPANFRVMKTSKQLLGSINGWQNGTADVRFDLGSGFIIVVQIDCPIQIQVCMGQSIKSERSDCMQDRHENSFTLKCDTDQRVMTSERDRISMQKYEFSKFNSQRLTQELCKLKAENTFKNIQYQQIVDFTKQSLFQPLEQQSTPKQFNEDSVNEHEPKTLDDSSTQRTRAVTNFHEKKQALISKKTISEHRFGQNKQAYLKLFKQLKSDSQLIKRKQTAKKSLYRSNAIGCHYKTKANPEESLNSPSSSILPTNNDQTPTPPSAIHSRTTISNKVVDKKRPLSKNQKNLSNKECFFRTIKLSVPPLIIRIYIRKQMYSVLTQISNMNK